MRVIEKTASKPVTAARLKATRSREQEWRAMTLEEETLKKARREAPEASRENRSGENESNETVDDAARTGARVSTL